MSAPFLRSGVFLGALLLSGLALIGFVLFAQSLQRHEVAEPPQADGIVVLTGGADRIDDALRLLETGKGRRLFISGVNVRASLDSLKRRWPTRASLFDCCIDLDYQARNTFENAAESARWLNDNGFSSLLLVTASYHMPRARLEFAAVMPGIFIHDYPVVPEASRLRRWWQDPALLKIITLEYVKYAAASLRIALSLKG